MSPSPFDELVERRGSHSYKWDTVGDATPMWVADMDFKSPKEVIDALKTRVDHGIFGYTMVPPDFYQSLIKWLSKRYDYHIEKDQILFTSGIIPALSASIKAITKPGDQVLVQTPVYNYFFSSVKNNNCELIESPLIIQNGDYKIDFQALESRLSHPKMRAMILCNPHNPVGRSWSKSELENIIKLCKKHDIFILSDEAHCDLVYSPRKHIPTGSLSSYEKLISYYSPGKTFNLAGLKVANIIVNSNELKNKIDKALNINEVCEINTFAIEAQIAAYTKCENWLEDLKIYLYDNYLYLKNNLEDLSLKISELEGTYLVWIDYRDYKVSSSRVKEIFSSEKIYVNMGEIYGKAGSGFFRVNIACPRVTLRSGVEKIRKAFTSI